MATVDEIRSVKAAFLDGEYPYRSAVTVALDEMAQDVLTRETRAEQQRELEAFGSDVLNAAVHGWNALRERNPKVDRSTGVKDNDINSFDDLPHKLKLNYLVFAQGALPKWEITVGTDPFAVAAPRPPRPNVTLGELLTAPLGTALPADANSAIEGFEPLGTIESESEPVVFRAGDKVKVTGPLLWDGGDVQANLTAGEVVTISNGYVDRDGDVLVWRADESVEYIQASSLTPVREPRVFHEGDEIPADVVKVRNKLDALAVRVRDTNGWLYSDGPLYPEFVRNYSGNGWRFEERDFPLTEVLND